MFSLFVTWALYQAQQARWTKDNSGNLPVYSVIKVQTHITAAAIKSPFFKQMQCIWTFSRGALNVSVYLFAVGIKSQKWTNWDWTRCKTIGEKSSQAVMGEINGAFWLFFCCCVRACMCACARVRAGCVDTNTMSSPRSSNSKGCWLSWRRDKQRVVPGKMAAAGTILEP